MVQIIKANSEDADSISELAVKTFYESYADFNTASDMDLYTRQYYSAGTIAAEMNLPDVQYFLALAEGKPVGFAKLRNVKQPEFLQHTRNIEIERIYVLKAYHKQQIGKALVNQCMLLAKEAGFEVIWLGVWQQNLNAIHFYEKNGFEKFGTHSFVLGEDIQTDLLMKMKL